MKMTDLRDLIEREIEQHLEWTTDDKSHVTTVSAKLFAEHVARLYSDHIPDAGKMVEPAVQGEPVAYAVFASNGNIRIWCSDPVQGETLRQQYGEALKPLYTAPQSAVQGDSLADRAMHACITYVVHGDADFSGQGEGLARYFKEKVEGVRASVAEQSAPDVAQLVEALEDISGTHHHSASAGEYFAKVAREALASYRRGDDAQ